MQYSRELVRSLHIFYDLFGFALLRSLVFETSRTEKEWKINSWQKVCVSVGGTAGNYCPGVGVDITLFPENVCVNKKGGNVARVWDSEELVNRTKKTCVYFTL